MRHQRPALPPSPSSSLPPLRRIEELTADQIFGHLHALSDLYCPFVFDLDPSSSAAAAAASEKIHDYADASAVDSGYVSETDESDGDHEDALTALRADAFERALVERWLTGLIARAETLPCLSADGDDLCQRALDHASRVLETFFAVSADEDRQRHEELAEYTRDFSFDVAGDAGAPIQIRLNDGLAGTDSSEPDDVGLQSWGASILVSRLLCAHPAKFGLTPLQLLPTTPPSSGHDASAPRRPDHRPLLVELGAGTGLISLVLHALLPRIGVPAPAVVATDYHPAVLANLRRNIDANMRDPRTMATGEQQPTIHTCRLDWSDPIPILETATPPLHRHHHHRDGDDKDKADMLIATDVIYAPEHAVWLRDCAARLLASHGVFWLVATVRQNGRFEGVSATVEAAFAAADDGPHDHDAHDTPSIGARPPRLGIIEAETLEKLVGVGRADESGYKVYRIEWV